MLTVSTAPFEFVTMLFLLPCLNFYLVVVYAAAVVDRC